MRSIKENLVMLENAKIPQNGTPAIVSTCDSITIQISTDSIDYNIDFEVSLDNEIYSKIEGFPSHAQDLWSTSCNLNGNTLWSFDIEGYEFFRCNLTKISNGSISIKSTSYQI